MTHSESYKNNPGDTDILSAPAEWEWEARQCATELTRLAGESEFVCVPKTLIARIINAYADDHSGECAAALEQGEIACTCGRDALMQRICKLIDGEDIDALDASKGE